MAFATRMSVRPSVTFCESLLNGSQNQNTLGTMP